MVPAPTNRARCHGISGLAVAILVANDALMWVTTSMLGIPLAIAKIMTEVSLFLLSYGLQRSYVFVADEPAHDLVHAA